MENLKNSFEKTKIHSLNIETIFRFCPDGIVCKDNKLQYADANESYIKTFTSENFNKIIGKKNNPYIAKDIMKLICDADMQVMKSCKAINYVINLKAGTLINVTTFPIIENNRFEGLISIIKDITQEEAIKEKFVNKHFEYINTEKNLQKQRETFVASLGHDLKNPTIAQIRGLELLLKGDFGEINNEQRELLEMVLESCKYMNGMLATLLATYRNMDGIINLKCSEFSFNDLVQECISEMIYIAKEKGITISIEKDIQNNVQADKVQLKRVIMNLISNGIKYAYRNSTLKLKIITDSISTHFEFENNSPYIPKEKQKTLFGQYVSYADTHKEIGIGLGLFASRKIIECHKGHIYLESFEDERNIFGFTIPTRQD